MSWRVLVRQFSNVRRAVLLLAVLAGTFVAAPTPLGAAGTFRFPQPPFTSPLSRTGGSAAGFCKAGLKRLGSRTAAYAAVVERSAIVWRTPGRGFLASFEPKNANTYPTVFGVRGAVLDRHCKARWYRVQVPLRPNGSMGYVRADAVWLGRVTTRIVVDLSERRVTLFRRGRVVIHAPAAIGAPATPTPRGHFYVSQRLVPTDRTGPYGPAAIGLSAFSNVLTGWTQGGPIAIHGTNQPQLIGLRATNGCIRLHNQAVTRLFRATPAGTPVVVTR